jgi:hypothetical protein
MPFDVLTSWNVLHAGVSRVGNIFGRMDPLGLRGGPCGPTWGGAFGLQPPLQPGHAGSCRWATTHAQNVGLKYYKPNTPGEDQCFKTGIIRLRTKGIR